MRQEHQHRPPSSLVQLAYLKVFPEGTSLARFILQQKNKMECFVQADCLRNVLEMEVKNGQPDDGGCKRRRSPSSCPFLEGPAQSGLQNTSYHGSLIPGCPFADSCQHQLFFSSRLSNLVFNVKLQHKNLRKNSPVILWRFFPLSLSFQRRY